MLADFTRCAPQTCVAELVVFLASDDASFSTGSEFVVDGGERAGDVTGGTLRMHLAGPRRHDAEAA